MQQPEYSLPAKHESVLAVGDPRRPVIGRAITGTLLISVLFVVFSWASKRARLYGLYVPWQDDPYDLVVTFTIFFVPLVALFCLARVTVCKRAEPLPVVRVRDLLRGCRVAVGAALVTLVFDGVSVITRAGRLQWNPALAVTVSCLGVAALLAGKVFVETVRAPVPRPYAGAINGQPPDWLTDFALVAERQCRWLGPVRRPARGTVRVLERIVLRRVQRHPLSTAALVATAMAAWVVGIQGLREGYPIAGYVAGMVVFGGGMFSLLATAGAYLGIIHSNHPFIGARRRAADAGVLACASPPLVFGFRDQLWRLAGTHLAQVHQIGVLMALSSVAVFLIVFALESLAGAHSRQQHRVQP